MSFINWGSEGPEQLKIRKQLEEQMLFEQAMQSAATAAAAAAGSGAPITSKSVYYLRAIDSSGGDGNTEPWDEPTNLDEMNTVFGPTGWTLAKFETLNPALVFKPETVYIFIDGGDGGADQLAIFLDDNRSLIEDWVHAGGRLFLNAAPNVGGNIDFGFDGVTLNYEGESTGSDDATIKLGAENHPIFVGPGECGTTWTGDAFSHANLIGLSPLSTLIVDPELYVICAEIQWGAGVVIFGTMTITGFHDPQPEAKYLRQNIHAYLGNTTYTPQLGLRTFSLAEEVHKSSRK